MSVNALNAVNVIRRGFRGHRFNVIDPAHASASTFAIDPATGLRHPIIALLVCTIASGRLIISLQRLVAF